MPSLLRIPWISRGWFPAGTRDQIANILWIIKKAREFQKKIYLCFIDYAKVLCGLQEIVENS